MNKFLIIGGTGVAGTAAIKAVREHFGTEADVTAVWYGRKQEDIEIEGADRAIFGDITDNNVFERITAASGNAFDYVFFATALGDVGFPIEKSTPDQIAAACRVSFDPLISLDEQLSIGVLVGYSTFYNFEHQRINYGAMGHAKERIEKWVQKSGLSRHVCIRAGAFQSASSKAIKLLLRRHAKELAASGYELLEKYFKDRKPSEAVELLEKAILEEERHILGETHTIQQNLVDAHLRLFRNPDAKFVNVCGSRIWLSNEVQLLSQPVFSPFLPGHTSTSGAEMSEMRG